jgi:hypothetical protein
MRCDGIVPEETVTVTPEKTRLVTKEREVENEDGETITEIYEEIEVIPAKFKHIPEHPCKETATILARSMNQVICNLGGKHWVKDGPDKKYCDRHNKPGTVTHTNGLVTAHPAMHISEYEK